MHRLVYVTIPALLALPVVAMAQAPQPASAPAVVRDAGTIAALDRMGAALRARNEINVQTDFTAEDILNSGQRLEYGGTIELVARKPNMMRVKLNMGSADREVYYDGKSATLVSPDQGFYATTSAPPTIREFVDDAEKTMGITIPLADLFRIGADPELTNNIVSAFPAGSEKIGGYTCDHYAMRQKGVDWQVWIRQGADPLPCKLVIAMTDDPGMPEFTSVYHWSTTPAPGPEAYTFKPAAGHKQISFGTIAVPQVKGKSQ
jgi:hypothetical protein